MTGKWHIIVIAAALGITAAVHSFLSWFIVLIIYLLLFCFLQKKRQVFYLLLLFATFLFFFFHTAFLERQNYSSLSPNETTFLGKIVSLPIIDGDRLSFLFKTTTDEKVQVNYYIPSEQEKQELLSLTIGMDCILTGELQTPATATNFHAFDYRNYLYFQKIHWILSPTSMNEKACRKGQNDIVTAIQQYRQKGITYIDQLFSEETKGITTALMYGYRGMIDENVLTAYESLGVVHLLAVSGLHVNLIVGTLYYVLLRSGLTKERTIEILLCFLPVYILLAGAAPSVIRASFMSIIVLVLLRLKKMIHPLDGISLVCIIYLLFSPYSLFHIGFQLSFLISYALIISSKTILSKGKSYLTQLFLVTFISQLFSLPLILYHFYEISWLSLPLNLLYIPFVSLLVLPLSFITTFFTIIFPSVGNLLLFAFERILKIAHTCLLYLQELSWGTIVVGALSSWNVLLLFVSIVYGCFMYENKAKMKQLLIPVSLFLLFFCFPLFQPYFSANGEVVFLDVGQGDSILIELPYRKAVYLIDTGGVVSFGAKEWQKRNKEFDVGKDVVVPFLKSKGIKKIDKLILTHGDFDHIGGALGLTNEIKVTEVLYGAGVVEGEFEQQLLITLYGQGSNITFVQEGASWSEGDAHFYVLSPQGDETSTNDRSIVIYAYLDQLYWLFTGDLEESGEQRIIANYSSLPVDVLKVGHHGSKTSSSGAFLDHIHPKVAVISAGRNNRFGHPHPDVLHAFAERAVAVFRTDQHGAIRFQFGKKGTKVETMLRK